VESLVDSAATAGRNIYVGESAVADWCMPNIRPTQACFAAVNMPQDPNIDVQDAGLAFLFGTLCLDTSSSCLFHFLISSVELGCRFQCTYLGKLRELLCTTLLSYWHRGIPWDKLLSALVFLVP
jgi:hypothetical protein